MPSHPPWPDAVVGRSLVGVHGSEFGMHLAVEEVVCVEEEVGRSARRPSWEVGLVETAEFRESE